MKIDKLNIIKAVRLYEKVKHLKSGKVDYTNKAKKDSENKKGNKMDYYA
jgi:hypothetical protein